MYTIFFRSFSIAGYMLSCRFSAFFFFNDTATTDFYTLSTRRSSDLRLLPAGQPTSWRACSATSFRRCGGSRWSSDRKSTRLNSSHVSSSYAVFCLKKKTFINTIFRLIINILQRELLRHGSDKTRQIG